MTDELKYETEGMRRTATQVDVRVEPQMAKAEARVADAAGHQGEEKWGTIDLGAPVEFGRTYEKRLVELEGKIHDLVEEVERFSQKVKMAASRADATEEEIAEIFTSKEQFLGNRERTFADGQPQGETVKHFDSWG